MRSLIILLSAAATQVGGDLCTGAAGSGTGLRGAYYTADPRQARPPLVRVDPRVDAPAVRKLPPQLNGAKVRWVRWCGWIRPVASGPHRFSGAAAMRIQVGQQLVAGPGAAPGASVTLEAGRPYAVFIELPGADTVADFSLQWTPPFGATYDVPPTVLFPPVATVQPGC